MEGSGHTARNVVAGVPRPGPAQLGLLCPPPSSRAPSSSPRGPRKEFSAARGVGLPFASRCSAAGSPSASLPPSSSPGPLLPRAAAPPPPPAPSLPASDSLVRTLARGSVSAGSLGPRLAWLQVAARPGLRVVQAPRRVLSHLLAPTSGLQECRVPTRPLSRAPGRTSPARALLPGRALAWGSEGGEEDGNRISLVLGGGGGLGLGRLAPTCSEVHGAGGRAGRARLLSQRLAEWEGEPRLRRSFNNPIRQAHSQVFFSRFRIFFSVWDILQTFFFLTCKAVTTNCSSPPRVGGRGGRREGRASGAPLPPTTLRGGGEVRQGCDGTTLGLLGEGAGRASSLCKLLRAWKGSWPWCGLLPWCRPGHAGLLPSAPCRV